MLSSQLSFLLFVVMSLQTAAAPAPAAAGRTSPPVATIAGLPVYEEDLLPLLTTQIRQLRTQEYELKIKALDAVINQKVLEAEAKRSSVSVDTLLEQNVEAARLEPTDTEVEAFYLAQQDRSGRRFEDLKPQMRQALKDAKVQRARLDYVARLREKAGVALLIRPPAVDLAYDSARVRGAADAKVTIVEFSDFQCPFCRNVQPVLTGLLTKYAGRVKLAYRDFPLRQIHPLAQGAAEASRCATEQGKFWEYHDVLIANPTKLAAANLPEHARSVGLDMAKFDACVASGKYRGQIEQDLQEGTRLGITGTPAIFINGIFMGGSQPAATFEKVIEDELSRGAAGSR
jgi:protein-disulfide isomerase